MRTLIFFWLLSFGCAWLSGCESNHADSVPGAQRATDTNGVEKHPNTVPADTAALKALFQEGRQLADSFPDSAIAVYNQILRLSKPTTHFNFTAAAYANLAYCYKQKKDFDQAERYLQEGVTFLQQAITQPVVKNDPQSLKHLYGKLIQFSQWLEMPAQAAYYYQTALPLNELSDPGQLKEYADMALGLAEAYFKQGQYDSATTIYFGLLSLLQPVSADNYHPLFFAYTGVAASSGRLSKPALAMQYFDSAKALAAKTRDSYLSMMVATNLGTFFLEEADFAAAKTYALQALDISDTADMEPDGKMFGWFQNSYTLSAALMQEERAEEALPYSQLLLKAATGLQSKTQLILAHYILGSNYLRLNRYEEAVSHLNQGLALAQRGTYREYVSMISGQLGIAYAGLGNYEQAYIHKSNYISLKDSFRSKENATKLDELNAKYQVLQKDKVLAEKQVSIERQQKLNYIWAGSTILLALLLMSLVWRRKQKLTIEKLKASLAGEEKERERIAQELHDGIVSRLSVIKTRFSALPAGSRVHEEAYRDVVGQLDQSIREIRNTSHNLLPEPLRHADLEEILRLYCERINSTSKLEITLQVLGALPQFRDEFKLNIYRIIQELIQNLLKHADATTALLEFSIDDDLLELTLEDNGSPADWDKHLSGTTKGSGLQNLQNRIRLLQGRMEVEHHTGTSVYLYFPIKPHLAKK